MWWIVITVVVLALAAYAFWPGKNRGVDGRATRSRAVDEGRPQPYSNPSGPNYPGGRL